MNALQGIPSGLTVTKAQFPILRVFASWPGDSNLNRSKPDPPETTVTNPAGNEDLGFVTGNPWVFLGPPVPIPACTRTRADGYRYHVRVPMGYCHIHHISVNDHHQALVSRAWHG